MKYQGRNRSQDVENRQSMIPEDVQPWDYWKIGESHESPTNLSYGVCVPKHKDGSQPGFRVAVLTMHTIREHDDDTISIKLNDVSSNSIALPDTDFHGWIDHGVWHE